MVNLQKNWLPELIEECKEIVYVTSEKVSLDIIEMWHKVGSKILENSGKDGLTTRQIIQRLAEATKMHERAFYQAVQFANNMPKMSLTAMQELTTEWQKDKKSHPNMRSNFTWHWITNRWLSGKDKSEEDTIIEGHTHVWEVRCSICHKKKDA